MDTSEHTGNPSNHPSSSSSPKDNTHVTQVQRRELSSAGSGGATRGGPVLWAVTPFNSSPQTPRGMELVANLRVNSTLSSPLGRSPRDHTQDSSSTPSPCALFASQPAPHSQPASSQSAALQSVQATGG